MTDSNIMWALNELKRLQVENAAYKEANGDQLYFIRACESYRMELVKKELEIVNLRKYLADFTTQLMTISVSNGANAVSMPDEYVGAAHLLCYPESTEEHLNEWLMSKLVEYGRGGVDSETSKSFPTYRIKEED